MDALPEDYKLLIEIGNSLDSFIKSPGTPAEIRSNALYEIISKNQYLKSEFPTARMFNQFLRQQHQNGALKSFLSYRVDTSNKKCYQWFFFRRRLSNIETMPTNNNTIESNNNYYKKLRTTIASDGLKFYSKQEVSIYEQLKKCSHLEIKIDFSIKKDRQTKYADFIILNKLNGKEFFWEHFGMTNDEDYKTKMAEKLTWYNSKGFKTIEKGGNFICTYYSNENDFNKQIESIIRKITGDYK